MEQSLVRPVAHQTVRKAKHVPGARPIWGKTADGGIGTTHLAGICPSRIGGCLEPKPVPLCPNRVPFRSVRPVPPSARPTQAPLPRMGNLGGPLFVWRIGLGNGPTPSETGPDRGSEMVAVGRRKKNRSPAVARDPNSGGGLVWPYDCRLKMRRTSFGPGPWWERTPRCPGAQCFLESPPGARWVFFHTHRARGGPEKASGWRIGRFPSRPARLKVHRPRQKKVDRAYPFRGFWGALGCGRILVLSPRIFGPPAKPVGGPHTTIFKRGPVPYSGPPGPAITFGKVVTPFRAGGETLGNRFEGGGGTREILPQPWELCPESKRAAGCRSRASERSRCEEEKLQKQPRRGFARFLSPRPLPRPVGFVCPHRVTKRRDRAGIAGPPPSSGFGVTGAPRKKL